MRLRIRSRIVKGAPSRTFYLQRFAGHVDGRESWQMLWRSRNRRQCEEAMQRLKSATPADAVGIQSTE